MKYLIIYILLFTFSHAQNYTFLVNKYDKEMELESKIMEKIAGSTISKEIVLYIPKMTQSERNIYSKLFKLGKNCNEANFIFVKKDISDKDLCVNKNKLYFTNNYKKLLSNKRYFGAFFWSKSRPNIVFIKNRLAKYNISLPKSYTQFIEDL